MKTDRFCADFAESDYLRSLRNQKRKARNTERTSGKTATRRALDDHYAGVHA